MGRGLFFKIYTWFWLTVILAGVALEATAAYARKTARVQWATFELLLPDAARAASDFLERDGESGLAGYISYLQQTQPVMAFFFDDRGDELTRRRAPPAVRNVGLLAIMEPGIHTGGDNGEFAALQVAGGKGKSYAMVFVLQRGAAAWYWMTFPYLRLTAIILISGVFCFLIARHVTRPLLRLQLAVAGIAEGRLDARVSADLQRRGDEIAGLATDFNRMAARIEVLINEHKQLLANVSHELRSPLSRLLVALSLVNEGPQEEVQEQLERIGSEALRLDKLIGQLLALSRLDSAVDGVPPTAIDLTTLVHEVASDADFEGCARARRVVVAADSGCVIRGDEDSLRSALENILRNAVRHTPDGTKVEVSLRRELTRMVIRIRDHGAGVPDDMLRSIFAPFRRVENGPDGSGLGLAIAERAVIAHSGLLRASNAESGGLVVEMELPAGLALPKGPA
jgi:two-component system, OmpR family, sensor histidine kinase CpxA